MKTKISEDTEALRNLSLGEINHTLLFFSKCSEPKVQEFVCEIEKSGNANFDVQWFLHCFAARYCGSTLDLSTEHAKRILDGYMDPPSVLFQAYILGNEDFSNIDKKMGRHFARSMYQFSEDHPAVFRCLRKHLMKLVETIGDSRIVRYLGFSSIPFLTEPEQLGKLDFGLLEPCHVRDILMGTVNAEVLKYVERRYYNRFIYPTDIPEDFSTPMGSLINTSLISDTHFIDTFAKNFRQNLVNFRIDKIPEQTKFFSAIVPFLLAAYQPVIYECPEQYSRLFTPGVSDCIASQFKERVKNDIMLLKLIANNKGCDVPIEYVQSHSLPFHLMDSLDQDSAFEFASRDFYVYNDSDRCLDHDFIHGVEALRRLLFLMTNKGLSREKQIKMSQDIERHIAIIIDKDTRRRICEDIFSLLFLTDSNGEMICTAGFARMIVKMLQNVWDNAYVNRAADIMSKKLGIELKNYSTSAITDLLIKMENKEFDEAESIVTICPAYHKVYVLGRSIYQLETDETSLCECAPYAVDLNVEFSLVNGQTDTRQYAYEQVKDEYVKKVIENRMACDKEYWMQLIFDGVWEFQLPVANNLDMFPIDFMSTRQFTRFKRSLKKRLHKFISYLDSYYRCCLLQSKGVHFTPRNPLQFDFAGAIQGAMSVGSYQKAEDLARLAGVDLFQFILERPNVFKMTREIADYFRDKYPMECMTYLIMNRIPCITCDMSETMKRYCEAINCKMNDDEITRSSSWDGIVKTPDRIKHRVKSQSSLITASMLSDDYVYTSKSTEFTEEEESSDLSISISESVDAGRMPSAMAASLNPGLLARRRSTAGPTVARTESLQHHFHMLVPTEAGAGQHRISKPLSISDMESMDETESDLESQFIEALLDPSTQPGDLDDYMYRMNPRKCCHIICDYLMTIPEHLVLAVVDVVGYAMDLTGDPYIRRLLLKREIEQVTNARDDDTIVKHLIADKRYDLAAKFIREFAEEKERIVTKFVRKMAGNNTELRAFLRELPDFFEQLASEVSDALVVMADFCPDSIRPSFLAFASLPPEVRCVSSLVDRSTIAKAFCSGRIDLVRSIRSRHLVLFSEEDLVAILAESARSTQFKEFVKDAVHLSSLVKNKHIFMKINSERVQREIDAISVASIEDEFQASLLIDKMHEFSTFCQLERPVARLLENLVMFIDHKPYSRTGIAYTFHSESLFEICFELDLDDIAFELDAVDKPNYIYKRVYSQLFLGRWDDAMNFLARHPFKLKNIGEEYLRPFLYREVFYYEGIEMMIANGIDCFRGNGHPARMPFYKMIVANARKKKKAVHPDECRVFVTDWCDQESKIRKYIEFGEMNQVAKEIVMLEGEDRSILVRILQHAVAYKSHSKLVKEVVKLQGTQPDGLQWFWDTLIDYLRTRKIRSMLNELYLARGQLEELALVNLEQSSETDKITIKVYHIATAVNALLESLKHRTCPNNRSIFRPSDMSIEKLQHTHTIAELQLEVYNFFYQTKTPHMPGIDLFNDREAPLLIGSVLLEKQNKLLLKKLTRSLDVPKSKVVSYFFDRLSRKDPQSIIEYIRQTKKDEKFWQKYHHHFVRSIACSSNGSFILPVFINDVCPQGEIAALLLETDLLKEAYTVAVSDHEFELIPAIAHRASVLGVSNVVKFCSNWLEKNKIK